MPKDFWRFFSRIKGRKVSFLSEFSRTSGSKRSFVVCTTVVQLGILRLNAFTSYYKFTLLYISIEDPPIRLTDIDSGLLLAQNDDGLWGYVCNDNWNQLSSDITCRQLGYANAISFSHRTSFFDLEYPSLLTFQSCSASNFDDIYDCGYTNNTGYYSTCGNYFVSLECQTGECSVIIICMV